MRLPFPTMIRIFERKGDIGIVLVIGLHETGLSVQMKLD